ncbi:MAG: hypothetical protein QM756_08250 [Polyangiaceae bacterium]
MKHTASWLCGALLALGCGPSSSTGVGNPKLSFELTVLSDDADDAAAGAGGSQGEGGATSVEGGAASAEVETPLTKGQVLNASLSVAGLRFVACDSTQPNAEVAGPFVIDLIAGTTLPRIPAIASIDGGYCGLEAPLAPAQRPPALVGRSLLFRGERADGTRILLFSNMSATLRVRINLSVGSVDDPTPHLLWAFRPRRWLTAEEVDAAESELLDGVRTIVIDVDRHPLLYLRVRSRLAGRSSLFFDANDNGSIDPDERLSARGQGLENAD